MKSSQLFALAGTALMLMATPAHATSENASERAKQVAQTWTAQKRATAIPRDLVIDERGLGYLKKAPGVFQPYGHSITPSNAQIRKGPSRNDNIPPVIHSDSLNPAQGDIIGTQKVFSAYVTDNSGRAHSVTFTIIFPNGDTQDFAASYVRRTDTWQVSFSGFTDGCWQWQVSAEDKNSNSATSEIVDFTVDTNGDPSCSGGGDDSGSGDSGSGDNSYIVTNAPWTEAGIITNVSGRIYFEMPDNRRKRNWSGYVCSGTVANDSSSGRSVIITAAHCIYDDVNKAFARNVLFIPNQAGTTVSGTDLNCTNDPIGCWAPDFGVVDTNWTNRTFPDNIEWDYGYYAVSNSGAHSPGFTAITTEALDVAAGSLPIEFFPVNVNDGIAGADSPDFTHARGYSYSDDPNFMYCAEDMTTEGAVNWWLPSCGLSGGSSGGSWIQDATDNAIMSVNSWGYTTSPGMAGPKLLGNSAECLFDVAESSPFIADSVSQGDAGYIGCN